MPYAVVQDLRDEGVPEALYDDDWVTRRIALATSYVDAYTGFFFEPRDLELLVDGNGSPCQFLEPPIIAIEEVSLDLFHDGDQTPIDLSDLVIYNRHLSGMLRPDDRMNPKIEFVRLTNERLLRASNSAVLNWPCGRQNVRVVGTFGYTDPDPEGLIAEGITPVLIREATIRLTIRNLPPKYSVTDGSGVSSGSAGPVIEERTRQQWVKFSDISKLSTQGAFTSDPEIDSILARYRRPPRIATA